LFVSYVDCRLDEAPPGNKYKSFFSLLKAVFEPLNDKKAELAKVRKYREVREL